MKYLVAKAGHSLGGKRLIPGKDEYSKEELGYTKEVDEQFEHLLKQRVIVKSVNRKHVSPGNFYRPKPKNAPMVIARPQDALEAAAQAEAEQPKKKGGN